LSYVGRTIRVIIVTLLFALAFTFNRVFRFTSGPRLLRWYFQTCDAAFVKIGQILAMRYDLLPAEYCDELSKLLDQLPPLPFNVIQSAVEQDLGRPIADSFEQVDPYPIGSASIAQVHRARLVTGEEVVVKVRRPGIVRAFHIDFANIRFLASVVDLLGVLGRIEVKKLAREMIYLTREELDFRREAQNIQIFHDLLAQDDIDHYAPRVYFDACGQAIITMEWLSGVGMGELIAAIQACDQAKLHDWAQRGITPKRTARLVMRSTLVQMFRHRMFHADPHVANLILLDGGTLGYVDYGMVGWLDERQWKQQFRLRQTIANEEYHAAYEAVLDILAPLPARDLSEFEMELKNLIRDWILASKNAYASTQEKSSGYFFLRLFQVVRRARLRIPFDVVRLFRTMAIADMVMLLVYPDIDWTPDLNAFIEEETRHQVEKLVQKQTSLSTIGQWVLALGSNPQKITDVLDWAYMQMETSRRVDPGHSSINRMLLSTLGLIRAALVIWVAAILVDSLFLAPYFPSVPLSGWSSQYNSVWLVIALLLIFVVILGRLRRQL
jgi:ubiquinone biosynthesis protein